MSKISIISENDNCVVVQASIDYVYNTNKLAKLALTEEQLEKVSNCYIEDYDEENHWYSFTLSEYE